MRRCLLALPLVSLAGCMISLDKTSAAKEAQCVVNTVSQFCLDAANHNDFTWIKTNIFDRNCFGSACHTMNGSAKLKLSNDPNDSTAMVSQDMAYMDLLGADGNGAMSTIYPSTRRLVVPGDPSSSYMELMIQRITPDMANPPATTSDGIPPSNIGYMPQANPILCCQKLDAIDRWITAGAKND